MIERGRRLRAGFDAWKAAHPHSTRPFPGLPYYLLHTVSHLLLTAVSLECGYPASSIRERVYALESGYGILLYTGSPDAEGTLGGLVETGRQIARHLRAALELPKSSGPVSNSIVGRGMCVTRVRLGEDRGRRAVRHVIASAFVRSPVPVRASGRVNRPPPVPRRPAGCPWIRTTA